jgi:hypothetical protein
MFVGRRFDADCADDADLKRDESEEFFDRIYKIDKIFESTSPSF